MKKATIGLRRPNRCPGKSYVIFVMSQRADPQILYVGLLDENTSPIYLFICDKLFPQILPAWILPLDGELTRVQFLTAPYLALQVNLGPFPANLSISQTDVRSDGSPVLFGSFVHRGHAHLAVTFRSPVVTQGLVLRGGERKRQCEKGGEIEAKHLEEQLVIWEEKKKPRQQPKKQVSHQVFNGFLVLVYFSQRLVVPLDFIDVLSQILQTQQQRAKDENWLIR